MPRKTPQSIWNSIERFYDEHSEYVSEQGILFDKSKKTVFEDTFKDLYNDIKAHYMREDITQLDHHKQAAILVYSLLKNSVVSSTKSGDIIYGNNPREIRCQNDEKKIFVELERIALKSGLEYMANILNEHLSEIGEEPIGEYKLPTPISCDNDYYIVLIRQLFYDFHYGNISNPEVYILSLANVFYLIEYMNLKDKNINIEKLKNHMKTKNRIG